MAERLIGFFVLLVGTVFFVYSSLWQEYLCTLILVVLGITLAVEKEELWNQ